MTRGPGSGDLGGGGGHVAPGGIAGRWRQKRRGRRPCLGPTVWWLDSSCPTIPVDGPFCLCFTFFFYLKALE